MSDSKYVLAMYDVRGKQDFIFRTNKLQEIVGGSWIIRDIFDDYLYDAAMSVGNSEATKGIFKYRADEDNSDEVEKFSHDEFVRHINDEHYIGEVVYEGGGNFLVLFKDMTAFKETTYIFTRTILERIGTLRVLATGIEIDGFDDFKEDRTRLYAKHRLNEASESNIAPWSCLPVVQVDRKTTQPLVKCDFMADIKPWIVEKIKEKGVRGKLSKESTAKLVKYYSEVDRIKSGKRNKKLSSIEKDYYKNENVLDEIVKEKGVDSQLAVVYVDGNNMGAKAQEATGNAASYDEAITKLRVFSAKTQEVYVKDGIAAALTEVKDKPYRIVVSAGDEINFVVAAKDALRCAEKYLAHLNPKEGASACAGIAVFHSHMPYADAYRIAEEACESGKQKMKDAKLETASFIDFHICQGAVGTSLEHIRSRENGNIISRPWRIWWVDMDSKPEDKRIDRKRLSAKYDADSEATITDYRDFINAFSRRNVKNLATAAKEGVVALQMEIDRMYRHVSKDDKKKKDEGEEKTLEEKYKDIKAALKNNPDKVRGAMYDISIAYDLWFSEQDSEEIRNGN